MSDAKTDTDVIYVPGARNVYRPEFDVVILDEQLKEDPKAHDHILQHELEHAEQAHGDAGIVEHAALEFRTDVFTYFGDDETAQQVREYLSTYDPPHKHTWRQDLLFFGAELVRSSWTCLMKPTSWLYLRGRQMVTD